MTLTTYNEGLCKKLEPNVSTTRERFEVLKELHNAGIPTVVWLCPILPFINDTETLKEYIINKACKGFSSLPRVCTPNGTYYPDNKLYETGFYEGERYKAWEIILQTPSVFESYFANEKYTTGTTIKQRIEKQPNTSYEINESVISYVYEILNNDAFILSRAQFSTLVENADFSSIYGIMSKNKDKIK